MYAIDTDTSANSTLADEVLVTAALRSRARCRDGNGTLTHLFFSEDLYDIARAKAICRRCAVRELCLAGALERQEPWGVWGGELLSNGRIVVNKRPRGRPPRVPRPELVVDEVPVPAHFAEPLEKTA
jgi:WhiB family redox-sensing transcriptional regulator